jgi:hypothetical protein
MAITKPVPGSINAPLGSQQESGVNAYGGVNLLEISGLSSDIPISTSPANLATVTGGDIEIDQIFFSTDSTGLASGTNMEILTDDPIGLAAFFVETVANLGANASIDMTSASVKKQRRIIRNGYHLQIASTSAACTGSGKWSAYVQYRPCVQVAVLQ